MLIRKVCSYVLCDDTHLHLCLVVQRRDLVLAPGHLLWVGTCLFAQVGLVICPKGCACGIDGLTLALFHARQILLPNL